MRHRGPVLLLGTLILAAGFAAADIFDGTREIAPRRPRAQPLYRAHEAIVKFEPAAAFSTTLRGLQDAGVVSARRSRSGSHLIVDLDRDVPLAEALTRLETIPGVVWAEPNGIVHAHGRMVPQTFRPNDPLFFRQWHLRMMNAERAWGIQTGDSSVVVAVLDTGIAYEDFGPFRKAPDWGSTRFVRGFNVLTGTEHANDDEFHGTHVASVIAEATHNSQGVAGLGFGCALMPVKVLDADGFGSFADVAEGIYYAFRDAPDKAKIINLSLGGPVESRALREAIDAAVAAGTIIVASSGNDGEAEVSFPASHPRVIAVGAVDLRPRRARYSNYGPELDVVAPGGDMDRDDDGDGRDDGILQQTLDPDAAAVGRYDDFAYFFVAGTSQAAANASALAALLVRRGITSPPAVQGAMQATALDLGRSGRDDEYGHGLIRPVEALTGYGFNQ